MENKQNGCLSIIALPFRVLADLINSVRDPKTRNSSILILSILAGFCCMLFGISSIFSIVDSSSSRSTPTKFVLSQDLTVTANSYSQDLTAAAASWLPFTQTAAAIPLSNSQITTFEPIIPDSGEPTLVTVPTETFTVTPLLLASTSTARPTATLVPYIRPTTYVVPQQPPPQPRACCKVCTTGKACGDSCIARSKTCHKPPGCACNG